MSTNPLSSSSSSVASSASASSSSQSSSTTLDDVAEVADAVAESTFLELAQLTEAVLPPAPSPGTRSHPRSREQIGLGQGHFPFRERIISPQIRQEDPRQSASDALHVEAYFKDDEDSRFSTIFINRSHPDDLDYGQKINTRPSIPRIQIFPLHNLPNKSLYDSFYDR